MGPMKLCLFLLIAVAAVAVTSAYPDSWTRNDFGYDVPGMMGAETEDSRRLLFQYGFAYKYPKNKYLSYDALKKNNVPCGQRGSSYYACNKRKKANPYRRGCVAITGCARFTD